MDILEQAKHILTPEVIAKTPPQVVEFIHALLNEYLLLKARVEELEAKLNQNSSNSNKPPSSDSPFRSKQANSPKSKSRKKKKGHRQQSLRPTKLIEILPEKCTCGCPSITDIEPYYAHQEIELEVTHFFLHCGLCRKCSKTIKSLVPFKHRTGYGPRLSERLLLKWLEIKQIAGV